MVTVVSLVTVALDLLVDIVKLNHSRQVIITLPKLLCFVFKTALSTIHHFKINTYTIRSSSNDTFFKTGRVYMCFGLCYTCHP